ncbi:MFS transporter [Streptomyces lincolnensis]|uniref:MFS transporter n=1 Tax=Streptomyces lincolnensis TaxID=1915 RepID=UPI0037CDDFCB
MSDTPAASPPARSPDARASRAERFIVPATFITNLGNGIQLTAASYLVFSLEKTTLAVGWLAIAVAVPQMLLSLYFGKLADRFDRRKLSIIADVASALAAAALPVALLLGGPAGTTTYVVSFVLAIVAALFFPASNALIKERVPQERLGRFNANFEIALQSGTLLSAAVGGFVIAAVGVKPLFFFNAVTFAASAVLLLALGRRVVTKATVDRDDAESGAAVTTPVAARRTLMGLGLLYAIGNVVIIVGNTLLIVLVIQGFGSGIGTLGLVDALFGIGVLFAAATFKRVHARTTSMKVALIGYLGFAAVLALETVHLAVLLAVIPFAGLTFGLARIAARTALMEAVPEARAGFVFGATNAFGLAAGAVATVLISLLVDETQVRYGFYALAALVAGAAVVIVVTLARRARPVPLAAAVEPPTAVETAV